VKTSKLCRAAIKEAVKWAHGTNSVKALFQVACCAALLQY